MLLCGGKWQLCSIPRCLRRQNGGVGAQGRVRHQSATLASRTAPVRARHANPSKAADLLMVRTPARAVSIRGRVLEAPRLCADPYHHGRRSCASPRASGSGSRSRPRLSDCHAVAERFAPICTGLQSIVAARAIAARVRLMWAWARRASSSGRSRTRG